MLFKTIFIFMILLSSQLSFSEPVDLDEFVDVRLYRTECDARWDFSKYMNCLDRSGLIPGVRAAYLSRRGISRFYTTSREEGLKHCQSVQDLPENLLHACVNRFVAHKAQMIGTPNGAHTQFTNVEHIGSGSID